MLDSNYRSRKARQGGNSIIEFSLVIVFLLPIMFGVFSVGMSLTKSVQAGKASLENASEEDLLPSWTLRHGDTILMKLTKYELIRHSLAQIIHHRAQLGVFFRLLNIPLPKTYGPSADDASF